jgi:hypothetical protein
VLFNLHVEMVPAEAEPSPNLTMVEALQMVVDVWRAGNAWMRVGEFVDEEEGDEEASRERQNLLFIKDVEWDKSGFVTILLQHGDRTAADPALLHLDTGVRRTAGKTDEEGVSHAAHLLISTEQHVTRSGQCRALLERVPNISRSAVTTLINRILREEAVRTELQYREEETRRMKRCHPKLIGHYQLSHGLRRDLRDGKLNGVEFITRRVTAGFEEKDRIIPIVQTLTHKVLKSPSGSALLDFVQSLKDWGKDNGFEEMQLHFTRKDTQQNMSPRMSTELQDAEDAVYARLELIGDFTNRLEQCPDAIVAEIQMKMRAMFDQIVLWR